MDEVQKLMLESDLKALAQARAAAAAALKKASDMTKAVTESKEYQAALREYQENIGETVKLTADIKQMALDDFAANKAKTINLFVHIRESSKWVYSYDPHVAFEWAQKNAPALVTLDTVNFEKYARGVMGTPMAVPAFLTVKEEVIPQATIAENLDAWLPKKEENA